MKYENNMQNTYRLCIVKKTNNSEVDGLMRTVVIAYKPRRSLDEKPTVWNSKLEEIEVRVQCLMLLVLVKVLDEDGPGKTPYPSPNGKENGKMKHKCILKETSEYNIKDSARWLYSFIFLE